MWSLIKDLFCAAFKKEPVQNLGALPDDRPLHEVMSDISFDEIVKTPMAPTWLPLDTSKLPDWPVLSQDGSSACVAFTKAIMATMLYFARTGKLVIFSPKWIYRHRKNAGQEGMIGVDAFDIETNVGLVPEELEPSQDLSEVDINKDPVQPWLLTVAGAFKISAQRIIVPIKDIDVVASISQATNKPIMVWFNFAQSEWGSVPTIGRTPNLSHSVTLPSRRAPEDMVFGLYNGKKAIVIQDSWGLKATNFSGKRIITEEFYSGRNLFAAYSMTFKFDDFAGSDRPHYVGTIVSLQQCLRYEGAFPTNVAFYENMGPVTIKSIATFQKNHGIKVTGALDDATIALVRSIYP